MNEIGDIIVIILEACMRWSQGGGVSLKEDGLAKTWAGRDLSYDDFLLPE
uniref:Uncharacterized protein n=1 Tax=Nelumbo nucifera TaxID=4432 RepID=A0A822X921_NELNU|nr:TPA_asm: hypothetical protein HUJ06_019407 [Nelumbo nucifera]